MEFTKVINNRYSCRKYESKQISEQHLKEILEAGRVAPTAKNLQEQHIYVVQSPEKLAIIDKHTTCRFNAPTVLIVAYDKTNVYTYPTCKGPETDHRQSGVEDATIVATHMMLAATNAGIGSCWVNWACMDDIHADLGMPENEDIVMLLVLGYPSEEARPSKMHFTRKPLEETVTYL